MSGRRIEEVRSATQADPQIKALMNVIQYGWPECRKKCQSHALEFLETIEVSEMVLYLRVARYSYREIYDIKNKTVYIGHMRLDKYLKRELDITFLA